MKPPTMSRLARIVSMVVDRWPVTPGWRVFTSSYDNVVTTATSDDLEVRLTAMKGCGMYAPYRVAIERVPAEVLRLGPDAIIEIIWQVADRLLRLLFPCLPLFRIGSRAALRQRGPGRLRPEPRQRKPFRSRIAC